MIQKINWYSQIIIMLTKNQERLKYPIATNRERVVFIVNYHQLTL